MLFSLLSNSVVKHYAHLQHFKNSYKPSLYWGLYLYQSIKLPVLLLKTWKFKH